MRTPHVLFILTSADRMGNSALSTGSWLEELVAPYYAMIDARFEVTVASPQGGKAPLDEMSLGQKHASASTRRFQADAKLQAALNATAKLSTMKPSDYDAVFFPGGHGTMEDFPRDPAIKTIVEQFYAERKPLAALCHGPACLVNAKKPNGEPLIASHRFTCFSNEEEVSVGLGARVPFLLETQLKRQGGLPHHAHPFTSNVIVEGQLMTGQNPASAIPLAEAVIRSLRAKFVQLDAA